MKGAIKTVGQKLLKVAAFAVMAVMVFVGGFTTSELLRKEEQQSAIKGTGNSLQAQQTINNGISLMAADGSGYVGNTLGQSVPYGALKVTATVSPATAKNQTLSWSCAWAGTTSSWSSGKTVEDYFSLSTSGANAHEVYLWAKQPFGDQITVTATSTDGSNKTATMTVDFAKRAESVLDVSWLGSSFDSMDDGVYSSISLPFYQAASPSDTDFSFRCSDGTLDLRWRVAECWVEYTQGYQNAINFAGFGVQSNRDWGYDGDYTGADSFAYNVFDYDTVLALFSGTDAQLNYNKLIQCIIDCDGHIGTLHLKVESEEMDSFGNRFTYEENLGIIISEEYLQMTVENVTLSDSTLTF